MSISLLELIAVVLAVIYICGAWDNWRAMNQAQLEKDRMLAMSREETKRREILTGVVVNKPVSRIPPNPHRKNEEDK